jgi:beta-galactosidase
MSATIRALGVCYYPEHWPESQWVEDAARMADLGLTWVRIGEFAWSRLEAEPGRTTFDWLDRAIEVLGSAGLKVVLGTPTATPPRWMLDRHPDMIALDREGRPRRFGSRRHYCFSHRGYRAECARIVKLLAERYGGNRHVAAWQTDNEYGCHDTTLSYSAAATAAFRDWLAQRYQSPEALNRAWGNVFWSMEYASFNEIDLPNLTVTEANPSHVMDFRRFASDEVVSFNRQQVDIIRRHSKAPITHNFMGRITSFDHFAMGSDLDFASWDSYPLGFLLDRVEGSAEHKRRYLRQGDPDFQAFHHDLYRAVGRGHWWVMEQQPGPVNWAPYNPDPLPGMARLWALEALAHGAEAVCYFRWRQAPFAQEQMHSGLLRPDNVATPAFDEAAQVARNIAEMPEASAGSSRVGLVFDYASAWAWETQPHGRDLDYFRLVFHFYRGLRRLGLSIDILPSDSGDLAAYALVLVPGVTTLSQSLKGALEDFGGVALLGPRTNSRTGHFAIPVPLPPNLPGLDCHVERVESLPPDVEVPLELGGSFVHWRERLAGTGMVVERTTDGHPAVMASGSVFYMGGWPDEIALDRLLRTACVDGGVEIEPLPEGVRRRDTQAHTFYFNYNSGPVLHSGLTSPECGVRWTDRQPKNEGRNAAPAAPAES